MNWSGWSDFWSMGGYGRYVWSAYGVLALAIVAEVLSLRARAARARSRAISPPYRRP
jgi:heme exporter protein D